MNATKVCAEAEDVAAAAYAKVWALDVEPELSIPALLLGGHLLGFVVGAAFLFGVMRGAASWWGDLWLPRGQL